MLGFSLKSSQEATRTAVSDLGWCGGSRGRWMNDDGMDSYLISVHIGPFGISWERDNWSGGDIIIGFVLGFVED